MDIRDAHLNGDRDSVIILNSRGQFIAKYASIRDTARELNVSDDTVRRYINNGRLWKSRKVFLDFAL